MNTHIHSWYTCSMLACVHSMERLIYASITHRCIQATHNTVHVIYNSLWSHPPILQTHSTVDDTDEQTRQMRLFWWPLPLFRQFIFLFFNCLKPICLFRLEKSRDTSKVVNKYLENKPVLCGEGIPYNPRAPSGIYSSLCYYFLQRMP